MLPYPQDTKPDANALLRVLGGVLAFLSILLTLLGSVFHQRVGDLILATIVGIFALRVLLLWLGEKPQRQQPIAGGPPLRQVSYPQQSPSPSSRSRPLSQLAPEQHTQQDVPQHARAAAPRPLALPRSIRPQQGNWQDNGGEPVQQQQRSNNHGSA